MEYRPYSYSAVGMQRQHKDFAFFNQQLLCARSYLNCGKCASS